MIVWITALALALTVVLVARFLAVRSRVGETRSVILHLPCERVWEAIREFPSLRAAHARSHRHLVIQETSLRHGTGEAAGSVWRQSGRWSGGRYWADLEVTEYEPLRRLSVRLLRDSLGTHRGVQGHHCDLTLLAEGPAVTKLTCRLSARIVDPRLLAQSVLEPDRLRTRLLDLSLRSIKRALDGRARNEAPPRGGDTHEDEMREQAHEGSGPPPARRAPVPPPLDRLHDQP